MKLSDLDRHLQICASCPKMCAYLCPSFRYSRNESDHHTGAARLALSSILEAKESIYHCSGCELCQKECDLQVPVLPMLFKERSLLWQAGEQPEVFVRMVDALLEHGHPYRHHRSAFPKGGKVILTDCLTEHYLPHLLTDFGDKVEERLPGVRWISGFCCGFFLLACGAEEAFISYARQQKEWLTSLDTIYATSAECAYCLKVLYRAKAGIDLVDKVKELYPLWVKEANGALYHQSCYAKKAFGERATDFEKAGFYSCAGLGSFTWLTDTPFAQKMAKEWAYSFRHKKVITDCVATKVVLKESRSLRFYLEL